MTLLETTILPDGPLDVLATIAHVTIGNYDPCSITAPDGFVRAMRTSEGDATLEITPLHTGGLSVRAYGEGARAALEAASHLLGLSDHPAELETSHPLVRELARRSLGIRLGAAPSLTDALVMVALQQRVKWTEAARSYAIFCRRFSARAPGPHDVLLPPPPDKLARLSDEAFVAMGVDSRRADAIRGIASNARALEEARALYLRDRTTRPQLIARIRALPSVGPWTLGMALGYALGDPDALVVGDLHIPHLVTFALAREPRGTDARMQELLEPFAPHRFRVLRLLMASGISAPKYGPRLATRRLR